MRAPAKVRGAAQSQQATVPNTPASQLQGDYYDLWDQSQLTPYTFDVVLTQSLPGGGQRTARGLNYEPEQASPSVEKLAAS